MSLRRCPPGAFLVLQSSPRQLLPLALVAVANHFSPYHLSGYVWGLAYALAIPFGLLIQGIVRHIGEEIEIRKLGARRVPMIKPKKFGGLDLAAEMLATYNDGYMGDILREWTFNGDTSISITVLWGLVTPWIFTVEPEHIKAVFTSNFDNFERGKGFHRLAGTVLGSGVFNSDGERWKYHRAMTRPFFARDRVSDFDIFNNHAETAITRLNDRFLEGEAIDFQDLMSRFTLDSATEFLFGSDVHSLAASLPYAWNSSRRGTAVVHSSDKFATAFNHAQERIAIRLRAFDVWPWTEFFKDQTKDCMKVIYEYVDPILRERLARKTAQKNGTPMEQTEGLTTLLDHLLEQTNDFELIRDEMLNVMIAGRDTTMATITFVVHCLAQYPAILARLREEILTQVGPTRDPTIEDVKNCKYLRAVINETLRLYPPVPFNMRRSKNSSVWPSPDGGKPFYVPAKIDIPFSVFLMHRRPDLWGPDADNFDPDRFLDARLKKYLTPNPFIFLPFSCGPRICLGQQFAYNEASCMVIKLLQAFETITLASDAQPLDSKPPRSWKGKPGTQGTDDIWTKCHLTTYSKGGLWVRMKPAKHTDTV